jgi:hypothetical protein
MNVTTFLVARVKQAAVSIPTTSLAILAGEPTSTPKSPTSAFKGKNYFLNLFYIQSVIFKMLKCCHNINFLPILIFLLHFSGSSSGRNRFAQNLKKTKKKLSKCKTVFFQNKQFIFWK